MLHDIYAYFSLFSIWGMKEIMCVKASKFIPTKNPQGQEKPNNPRTFFHNITSNQISIRKKSSKLSFHFYKSQGKPLWWEAHHSWRFKIGPEV